VCLKAVKGENVSQIFDALQRSESERSGLNQTALSQPTEMLQRVERDETAKWATSSVVADTESLAATGDGDSFQVLDVSADAAEEALSKAARVVRSDSDSDAFAEFQSLDVSLSPESRVVSATDIASPATEAFRLLAVRLRALRRNRAFKKVLITSTIPQEGKSTVSANLACTLARMAHQKTLLLEGDVRRPSLSRMFGVGSNPGLCECLRRERSLSASIYHLQSLGLWLLPAGESQGQSLEHLQSDRLPELMEKLTAWFDWIIIDSPPVLPLADTSIWTRLTEGILLVTRQGTTERQQLKRGLEALERQKLIGALLNSSKYLPHADYYYHSSTATQSD
jgi:capsular exopolysaccharide synthesis family protein